MDAASRVAFIVVAMGWLQGCVYNQNPDDPLHFPIDSAVLKKFIRGHNEAALRAHGWFVAGNIVRESRNKPGIPTWLTWDLKRKVLSPNPESQSGGPPSAPPADSTPTDPDPSSNNGKIPQVNEVHLNPSASAFVREHKLNQGQRLQWMRENHKAIDFGNDAIAVKAIWTFIRKEECKVVPVWNEKGDETQPPAARFLQRSWPEADSVQVCPSQTAKRQQTPNGKPYKEVPLSRFYSLTLSGLDETALNSLDPLYPADQLSIALLLGLDFTTKEQPEWFWGTLWWHPSPDDAPYGSDRPSGLFTDRRWNNYRLNVVADQEEPREGNALPKAAYNPYLELSQSSFGNHSNCMSCHSRAFWSKTQITGKTLYCDSEVDQVNGLTGPVLHGKWISLVTEGNFFSSRCIHPRTGASYPDSQPLEGEFRLSDYLQTDFLWSLADVPGPPQR